jgi:FKBP-type peptidyl-prolyl cis-trans isomerase (trigger factor)
MVTLGEILYPNFINYVKIFTRAGDIALARDFMNDYMDKLPAKLSESCLNFSDAYILHYEGNFSKALALISKVSFPWVIMKVQVKIMQIQLNYQLGYYEETREQVEYFRKSLTKEENISADYKSSILGFLKLTVMLINIVQANDRAAKDYEKKALIKELDRGQKNHFGIKFWLEDRLAEIK